MKTWLACGLLAITPVITLASPAPSPTPAAPAPAAAPDPAEKANAERAGAIKELQETGLTEEGAEEVLDTRKTSGSNITEMEGFEKFGFGPAIYLINYDEEIIDDATSDVRINNAGQVSADTTRSATHLGLEVHYTFWTKPTVRYKPDPAQNGKLVRDSTSGWSVSPTVGIFDLDDGISGQAYGLVYSRWHGDANFTRQRALNIGATYINHRKRTVFVDGVDDGKALPAGFQLSDVTRKKDVNGFAIFISYSLGF
jgi:hypothetical protein